MEFEKYYNEEGQVAVLYSPGFGAGWSTWAGGDEFSSAFLTMDKGLVMLALQKARELEVEAYLASKLDDPDNVPYLGGWSDIAIKFVDKGDQFRIHEYDGSESVEVYGPSSYMVA